MPYFGWGHGGFGHGFGHRGFGYRGFGHGGWRRHRAWPWLRHPDEPPGPPPDGDGDSDAPPHPPSPLPFPFPPLPGLEIGETEAWQHRGHRRRHDDQEMGLNGEPIESRDMDARRLRRRGRWVRSNGKLILFGV